MNPRHALLSAVPLLFTAASAACGTVVVSGSQGGAGGAGSTSVTTSSQVSSTTSTTTTTSSTVTSSSSSTSSGGHIDPPPPPPPGQPAGMGVVTMAITRLYLGNTDRDGTPDPTNGWKQYGFDLDGKISTVLSTDLCKPANNAVIKNVYPDGNGGTDNSFGKNILPMLLGISSDFPQKQNDALGQGKYTLLFNLQQIGPNPDYDTLLGLVYQGANLGAVPKLDGTDLWPIDPVSLADPMNVTTAKTKLFPSYLSGNTVVGLVQGELDLSLTSPPGVLPLKLQHAFITMDLDASRQHATNGTIAGVLPVAAFTNALKQLAGQFDPTLCSGPTIDSIISQAQQAGDIMADGSQDPTKVCDAISVGIGFDASAVQLGPIAAPTPPPPNPCP